MHTFLMTLHIILSFLLVFVILMQPGKGADPSSAFGGGAASQIFGASGPGNLLTRSTGVLATMFMITSITLAYQSTKANQEGGGVEDGFKDVLDEGAAGEGFGAGSGKKPASNEQPTTDAAGATPPAPTEAPPSGMPDAPATGTPADPAAPTPTPAPANP
jgi:preprotein translocase subunit SecG